MRHLIILAALAVSAPAWGQSHCDKWTDSLLYGGPCLVVELSDAEAAKPAPPNPAAAHTCVGVTCWQRFMDAKPQEYK